MYVGSDLLSHNSRRIEIVELLPDEIQFLQIFGERDDLRIELITLAGNSENISLPGFDFIEAVIP